VRAVPPRGLPRDRTRVPSESRTFHARALRVARRPASPRAGTGTGWGRPRRRRPRGHHPPHGIPSAGPRRARPGPPPSGRRRRSERRFRRHHGMLSRVPAIYPPARWPARRDPRRADAARPGAGAPGRRQRRGPVGACVLLEGRVAREGFNQPIRPGDPTAHAEIVALRAGGRGGGQLPAPGRHGLRDRRAVPDVRGRARATPGSPPSSTARRSRSGGARLAARRSPVAPQPSLPGRGGVLEAECRQLWWTSSNRRRASRDVE
jgi:hypothetical protein